MQTYRPTPASNVFLLALKIIILIVGLFVAVMFIGKFLNWILGVVFILARVLSFVVIALLALYALLKLLFNFDLWRFVSHTIRRY